MISGLFYVVIRLWMHDKISKADIELLSKPVDKIISTEVLEKSVMDKIPLLDELPDTNKTYCGKISVLFVDIRESTKLPEMFSSEQLVKIYRSYIRTVVQAIRYSGGVVRDFMGDGVLAIFVDDEADKSGDKAVHAARYITTVIDKILNSILEKEMKYRISCGIGVHTGEVSLSKVGMKGKEQDDETENEYGIAWIGNSTSLACKYSGAVECGTIFISDSTYVELSNIDSKQNWESISFTTAKIILKGT
ncbi:MAG: adenylate/guanylate cyclase domain-containing protein [Lachnospiraceae bacterium]|nr:adenylate/guanylate cyclase domain-containing protein [Lachnospiraceae bacterium]